MRFGFGVAVGAALALAGCGDAPETVQGGNPLFAPPIDCTPSTALCGTWTHMYGCYFGPQAASGGCAGSGGECHATPTGTGAIPSGFVCGATQATCFSGITMSDNVSLATLVNPAEKTSLALNAALYHAGGTPGVSSHNMPLMSFGGPPVMNANWSGFTPADLQCVADWVTAGAPNN